MFWYKECAFVLFHVLFSFMYHSAYHHSKATDVLAFGALLSSISFNRHTRREKVQITCHMSHDTPHTAYRALHVYTLTTWVDSRVVSNGSFLSPGDCNSCLSFHEGSTTTAPSCVLVPGGRHCLAEPSLAL